MNGFERFIRWDQQLFHQVNGVWTHPLLDTVFPYLRESVFWVPLYLFLLIFIWTNFGLRGLYWAAALICTASLCDIISSHIIKENFFRLRPCRNGDLPFEVRFIVKYCPMSSSFISSHATSHFGVAVFLYNTLRMYTSSWMGLFFAWAAAISYAQVYVGVHFPIDVLAGALVGTLIGLTMSRGFNKFIGLGGMAAA